MSIETKKRHPILVLILTLVWFIGLLMTAVLVAYIPGALGLVDDERWGRTIVKVLVPGLVPLLIGSVLFARRKFLIASILSGLVIFVLLGFDAWAIALVTRH